MANYTFSAALNASHIPVPTRSQPRPVLIGQLDNRLKNPTTTNTDNKENNVQNLPQVVYAENVMPTRDGLSSVGYTTQGAAFPGLGIADEIYTIFDIATGAERILCPAQGHNYIKSPISAAWVSYPTAWALGVHFSTAYVNGQSFVCYEGTFLGHWNEALPGIVNDSGSVLGLVAPNAFRAICASGNYLIAITSTNEIAWSSLTNPLDFTPDLTTGAGREVPVDMKGVPLYLTSISGGFLIHCTHNIIAAVYTQNSAQPWIFREVKGSGGMEDSLFRSISKTGNSATTYAYTTQGLQTLNLRESEIVHADITDALETGNFETFSAVTKLLTLQNQHNIHNVCFLGNRFLCLSYGGGTPGQFTRCMIYDSELARWGQLTIDHVTVFYNGSIDVSPRNSLYILQADGTTKQVVLGAGSSVVILGRYQLSRSHQICSQDLELEVLNAADTVAATLLVSYNGATTDLALPMTLYESVDGYRHFQEQYEGTTLSYAIEGNFHLASALITITKGAVT